jgi:hypothetical protein
MDLCVFDLHTRQPIHPRDDSHHQRCNIYHNRELCSVRLRRNQWIDSDVAGGFGRRPRVWSSVRTGGPIPSSPPGWIPARPPRPPEVGRRTTRRRRLAGCGPVAAFPVSRTPRATVRICGEQRPSVHHRPAKHRPSAGYRRFDPCGARRRTCHRPESWLEVFPDEDERCHDNHHARADDELHPCDNNDHWRTAGRPVLRTGVDTPCASHHAHRRLQFCGHNSDGHHVE